MPLAEAASACWGVVRFCVDGTSSLLSRKHKIKFADIKKDANSLIKRVDKVADLAIQYWTQPGPPDTLEQEILIQKALHFIAEESLRLHEEYGLFNKAQLVRANGILWEAMTKDMPRSGNPAPKRVHRIYRCSNLYIGRVKRSLSKRILSVGNVASLTSEDDE